MSLSRPPQLLLLAKGVARQLRRRQTPAERLLWDILRNRRFHGLKFLRQHQILVDDDGRESFVVADFYCAEKRLILEIDGPIHRFQREADARRSLLLADRGYRVLRLTNDEIEEDLGKALRKIEKEF